MFYTEGKLPALSLWRSKQALRSELVDDAKRKEQKRKKTWPISEIFYIVFYLHFSFWQGQVTKFFVHSDEWVQNPDSDFRIQFKIFK